MIKKIFLALFFILLLIFGTTACTESSSQNHAGNTSEDISKGKTLTFYSFDGDTVVTTMEVSNQRIEVPAAPTIEGYTFVGWYLDSPSSSLKIDAEFFVRNNAHEDRNAYPRYVKYSCKLSFYSFDGDTVVTTMEVSNQRIKVPAAPTIEGYTFVGWYLDSPSSSLKIDAEFFMRNNASKDRNAYAKYVKDYCKLSFYSDGYIMKTIDIADEVISLPEAPEKNHYNFQYWYMIDANGDEVVLTEDYFVNNNAEDDYEAHAKFERVKYTLTFMYNGEPYECGFYTYDNEGNLVIDKNGNPILTYKSTIEVSDGVIELPAVVPAAPNNSIFDGWYLPNYTVAINESSFVSNPANRALNVEAKFKSAFEVLPTGRNTCTIIGYIGKDKNVEIPKEIVIDVNGTGITYKVTSIDKNAFKENNNIESIVIPEGVEKIGNNAFENCTSLKTVYIPASVTEIDATAFRGCTSLTSVNIDENNPVYRSEGNNIVEKGYDDNTAKTYTVTIVDENNTPVEGVRVILTNGTTFTPAVSTDANGKASAEFDEENIVVMILNVPEGYEKPDKVDGTTYHGVFASDSNELTIQLEKKVTNKVAYTLTIVDDNGDAVEGMEIQLSPGRIWISTPFLTNENGQITVEITPDYDVYVRLFALDGYTLPEADEDGYHAIIPAGETCIEIEVTKI